MRIISLLLGLGLLAFSLYLTFVGVQYGGALASLGAMAPAITFLFPFLFFVLGILLVLVYFVQTIGAMIVRTLFLIAVVCVIGWVIWGAYTGNPTILNVLQQTEALP